jgi:16S rRNA (cytosine967-C5)-methyltransferase
MNFLLRHIIRIIEEYTGNPPLAGYLKSYFKLWPELGSRDRRAISEAVFVYYRCAGFTSGHIGIPEIILQGLFWCESENGFLKDILLKNRAIELAAEDNNDFVARKDFPEYSSGMNQKEWIQSMFQQPEVFIRIRKEKEKIFSVLSQAAIPFRVVDTNIAGDMDLEFYKQGACCIALPKNSKLEALLPAENYVVQDWASQCSMAVASKFWTEYQQTPSASVWDVCAGAGGKSLFWIDKYPGHQMLASDIRNRILHNLKMRWRRYAIPGIKTSILDATSAAEVKQKTGTKKFDAIICDVPCSGSGTWGRTPEQLYFFQMESLERFRKLQLPIALNAQSRLKTGGLLFYITCSVFADENENVVAQLLQQSSLKLLHQQLINGIQERADSLFIAVFQQQKSPF